MNQQLSYTDAEIIGEYHSDRCLNGVDWGIDPQNELRLAFRRAYRFGPGHRFEVQYVFYENARCEMPSFTALWEGSWKLDGAVPGLPHTRYGSFPITGLKVAILDDDILADVNRAREGELTLGMLTDATTSGFEELSPLLAPVAGATDHDIVFLHRDVLKTGLRTPTMMGDANGRPTQLQEGAPSFRRLIRR